jgi:imidazolonepropionase-like amidohydrolase
MEQLHEAGVSTFDVLRAATVTGARYLKRSAIAGTISEGKNAEFIILAKNPFDNIKNTREIEGVMLKGQWLDKKRLDKLLLDVKNAQSKL